MKYQDKYVLKCFYNFLKNKNIYNLYEKNLISCSGLYYRNIIDCETSPQKFLASISGTCPTLLISLSFRWSNTEEGWDFWNKIDCEWCFHYNNVIKK